jgi:hypothetical protein
MILSRRLTVAVVVVFGLGWTMANRVQAQPSMTDLSREDIDAGSTVEWSDGQESKLPAETASWLFWTKQGAPRYGGARFADNKKPGVRHLRAGFKTAQAIGSILLRGTVSVSVLKEGAAYPGNVADDAQWTPAERILAGKASSRQLGEDDYALWILPPGTKTRALRFTHEADLMDRSYAGWVGGVYLLKARVANLAPEATALASARSEAAGLTNNLGNEHTWGTWDNGSAGAEQVVSAGHPAWVMLVWPREVPLSGLATLWTGFAAVDVQVYAGGADTHPRQAPDSAWKTIKSFDHLKSYYPLSLGVNLLDFGQSVSTRAIRLRITQATDEGAHPHLKGKTFGGKRVWLGEVMALAPLGQRTIAQAAGDAATLTPVEQAGHPPIPVHFTLKEPGYVTLVIEDLQGQRIRNLVSEMPFPAGDNTAWWDGMDDLGRDTDAARHGVYHVPGTFVAPGRYRVRGLTRSALDLRYEFSIYNAGHPAWPTADHTGGWLTNHTPPSAALFIPAQRGVLKQDAVYLGSYVSEGGDGLAWVDLEGHKLGGQGHVGGNWTGAPYLARDAGAKADPNTYAYVGSAWEGDLRLTALTQSGERPVVQYRFATKDLSAMSGLAVHDGLLVASLPKLNQLLFVDARAGAVLGTAAAKDPRGLAFDAQGRLLVLSGEVLNRYRVANFKAGSPLPAAETVVSVGLEDPQGVTCDGAGNIYISDRGNSHQVKVFSSEGKLLRSLGHPGAPRAGAYDPLHMNNPRGITIDSQDHLWVAEEDFQPKRVSVWTLDGKLVNAFYGPSEYGGGGTLDPRDKTRFYYHGMEFKLDWDKGTDQLASVIYRPDKSAQAMPSRNFGTPEAALYRKGQRYFTNSYNSHPTNGAPVSMLWIDRKGLAIPAAAMGSAQSWELLKTDAFAARWPEGVDPHGEARKNPVLFAWSDTNGNGRVEPDEVAFEKAVSGGVVFQPDLSVTVARVNGQAMRYAPTGFLADGVPTYSLDKGQVLVEGAQAPTTSGGDQALVSPDGWSVLTVAPKPFAPQSVGGAKGGKALWSYPSLWPGLHASHESAAPDRPGELVGTTRLLGTFVTPRHSDAGALWAVNGNMGNMYLFTEDGLFVATLFHDIRQGRLWSAPIARRDMLLNDLTLHDENFWPTITQTADGKIYLVDGARTSLVRIDGLESIHRLPPQEMEVSKADLAKARDYLVQSESARQKHLGSETLAVPLAAVAPTVDGKLDDWAGAQWATIDRRGVKAWFNSNSKPYDASAAVKVAGDRLYVAFRTTESDLLRNSGEMAVAPFKTGGALDVMMGTNPQADPKRKMPVAGDLRLLVTKVKGKPLAMLYRAVVPGTAEPVPFSSPWRTITMDRVDNITDQVQLAADGGNYELSVPLAVLGLRPAAGETIKADLGVLRGNGFETLQRVYWSNKATGLTSDVPSEAQLTPELWGSWNFVAAK